MIAIKNSMTDGQVNRVKRQSARLRKRQDRAINAGAVKINRASIRNDTRECGWKALACAVIDQAITDYFLMVRQGNIIGGKLGKWKTSHRNGRTANGLYPEDVRLIVQFFTGGDCQTIMDLAGADFCANRLYARLRELEDSQRHLHLLSQGQGSWKNRTTHIASADDDGTTISEAV